MDNQFDFLSETEDLEFDEEELELLVNDVDKLLIWKNGKYENYRNLFLLLYDRGSIKITVEAFMKLIHRKWKKINSDRYLTTLKRIKDNIAPRFGYNIDYRVKNGVIIIWNRE